MGKNCSKLMSIFKHNYRLRFKVLSSIALKTFIRVKTKCDFANFSEIIGRGRDFGFGHFIYIKEK